MGGGGREGGRGKGSEQPSHDLGPLGNVPCVSAQQSSMPGWIRLGPPRSSLTTRRDGLTKHNLQRVAEAESARARARSAPYRMAPLKLIEWTHLSGARSDPTTENRAVP